MARKQFVGKVTSTKMQKTVVVTVESLYRHPKYGKIVRRHKKFKAHVPKKLSLKEGDMVRIEACRPISKEKAWVVKEVI